MPPEETLAKEVNARSASEAKARGVSLYMGKRPCARRGHLGLRSLNGTCWECKKEGYRSRSNPQVAHEHAKRRAAQLGIAFTITVADVISVWPVDNKCPILGIPLIRKQDGKKGFWDNSPSIDRRNPNGGYVLNNICIMSMRANRLKDNETDPAVFRAVADWLEGQGQIA